MRDFIKVSEFCNRYLFIIKANDERDDLWRPKRIKKFKFEFEAYIDCMIDIIDKIYIYFDKDKVYTAEEFSNFLDNNIVYPARNIFSDLFLGLSLLFGTKDVGNFNISFDKMKKIYQNLINNSSSSDSNKNIKHEMLAIINELQESINLIDESLNKFIFDGAEIINMEDNLYPHELKEKTEELFPLIKEFIIYAKSKFDYYGIESNIFDLFLINFNLREKEIIESYDKVINSKEYRDEMLFLSNVIDDEEIEEFEREGTL